MQKFLMNITTKLCIVARQLSLLVLVLAPLVLAADWGYEGEHGPDHWPGICTTGEQQSPVDLVHKEAKLNIDAGKLAYFNYKNPTPVRLTNNGHSVSARVLENCPRAVGAGGLPGVYYLDSFHFHWKSEHKVNGERYPLELHFVHLRDKYKSIDEARRDPHGLAVVGVFFEETTRENPALAPLLETVRKVSSGVGMSRDTPTPISLESFLPDNDHFFRYDGSLTTPGCDEIVVWTVLTSKLPISYKQLLVFQNIRDSANQTLTKNYRPVQPLNDRVVYYMSTTAGSSKAVTPGVIVLLFVALSANL